ncbi:glycosyltransferase [Flavobacteriaceae bacterium R38]|nr:glycosyltransferase [Flavobacteriaceae bacterium R38]
MSDKKRILIAPLNWGLGHATRCIPIINALLSQDFTPIIASDGVALALLKKEFPELGAVQLPSYQIKYPKKGKNFKLKMLLDTPKMLKAIKNEKKQVKQLVKELKLDGIISDNRFGVYHKKIPSVFITHQLNVLTGNTTWLSSKMHQSIIKKFKECWVPDFKGDINLSGRLGHLEKSELNIKYIGPLSRLSKRDLPKKYDTMVILSGPEPQRTLLEEKLSAELKSYKGVVLFVKGKIEPEQKITEENNITFYNFMNSEELEAAFNESEFVVSRSGYTTIMDLAKLEKKAFFIPTPGQYEQEYLAKRLKKSRTIPFSTQEKFKIKKLEKINNYRGFIGFNNNSTTNFEDLFTLFHSE